MKPWKKLVLVGVSIGVGFAVCAASIIAVFIWYDSRPTPPKPWDSRSITAEFDRLDTEGENNNIVFYYTLQNNTDFDYRLPEGSTTLMAQLEQTKSLSASKDGFTTHDTAVFLPAKQRYRYAVHVAYPYEIKLKDSATDVETKAWREKLGVYVNDEMSNLNGFVLFDEANRYQVILPKGW